MPEADTYLKLEVSMARRVFSREFKLEAVRLVRDWGVLAVQAAGDLDVSENVVRRWVMKSGGFCDTADLA